MDLERFRQKLTAEQERLTAELTAIARRQPGTPGEWQARPEETATDTRDDVANKFEELQERRATEHNLELRLREVIDALTRIDNGTYGRCVVDGGPIEEDRLEANPAAQTCKRHLNDVR